MSVSEPPSICFTFNLRQLVSLRLTAFSSWLQATFLDLALPYRPCFLQPLLQDWLQSAGLWVSNTIQKHWNSWQISRASQGLYPGQWKCFYFPTRNWQWFYIRKIHLKWNSGRFTTKQKTLLLCSSVLFFISTQWVHPRWGWRGGQFSLLPLLPLHFFFF